MTRNTKKGLIALLGGLGLIIFLIPIFTTLYSFNIGLITAIAIWIITGAISTMLGIKDEKSKESASDNKGPIGIILASVLIILGILVVTSYFINRGSGVIVEETRSLENFNKVVLESAGNMTIEQSGKEALVVKTDDNLLSRIKSEIRGDTLIISYKPKWYFGFTWPTSNVDINLSVKDLDSIKINGSGTVNSSGLATSNLEIKISGSGKVNLDSLILSSLIAEISGSGEFNLSGLVDKQQITINGSGNYNAKDFRSRETSFKISGAGDGTVSASDKLDVIISGSGKINYYGNPAVTQNISGSGSIVKVGE